MTMDIINDLVKFILGRLSTPETLFFFVCGLLFIILNLRVRFSIISGEYFSANIGIFSLKDLVSEDRYLRGLGTYFTTMILIYFVFVTAGPALLKSFASINVDPQVVPLFVALVLAGFIPNIEGIDKVEVSARQFSQRVSGIPSDHKYTLEKIDTSRVDASDVSKLISERSLNQKCKEYVSTGLFSEIDRDRYIKIKLILFGLLTDPESSFGTGKIASRFTKLIESSGRELEKIQNKIDAWALVENELKVDSEDGHDAGEYREKLLENERLKKNISERLLELLWDTSSILSCVLVIYTSAKKVEISKKLNDMGLQVEVVVRPETYDRVLGAVAFSFILAFVISFVFAILKLVFKINLPQAPSNIIECVVIALSFSVPLYVGLNTFLKYREKIILKSGSEKWYLDNRKFQVRPSMRLWALGKAFLLIFLSAALISPLVIFMISDQVTNVSKLFDITTQEFWHNIIAFVLAPISMVAIFSFIIEYDREWELRKLEYKAIFNCYIPLILLLSILIGALNVSSNYISAIATTEVSHQISVNIELLGHKFTLPNIAFATWYFSVSCLAIGAFLYSFARSNGGVLTTND